MSKPPPPPPGPPPPPSLPVGVPQAKGKSGGADNRGQLLADIRTGARLKKAVTNDRSAPIIETKNKSSGMVSSGTVNGAPPGLAGLFAGGMPKLKPPGANRGQMPLPMIPPPNRRPPENCLPSPSSNSQSYPSSPKPYSKSVIPAGYGTVRRVFPNDMMKGMAPQPPPASQKPGLGSSSMGAADSIRMRPGPPLPSKPPNVPNSKPSYPFSVPRVPPQNKPPPPPKGSAIRPGPALPNKPRRRPQSIGEFDVKHSNGANHRPVVQVKIAPNSPSPSDDGSISASSPDFSKASIRNASTPNLLQIAFSGIQKEAHGRDPPPPPNRTTPYLRPPTTKPPPPPPQRQPIPGPPSAPPPPPVNQAQPPPPPPPHKMTPMPQMQGKMQVHNSPNSAPPPPPVRNSSTRNGDDFESRWYSRFLSINDMPPPTPFTNCIKTYPSKGQGGNRREPAPPVPTESFRVSGGGGGLMGATQLQLGNKLWEKTTSEC